MNSSEKPFISMRDLFISALVLTSKNRCLKRSKVSLTFPALAQKDNQLSVDSVCDPPHSLNDEYYSKFFDSVANSGFNGFLFNFTHRILEKKSPVSKRILEVGAGRGQHIKYVNLGYEDYVASDLNPKMALTGEKYPNVVFENFDVSQIPYPEDFFDRVISTCLLHHVSDVENALKEMKRVTRPGGRISLYVSCDPGLLNRILRRMLVIPKARKLGFFDYPLLISREHRNHFQSIDTLIEFVFKNSIIKKNTTPQGFIRGILIYLRFIKLQSSNCVKLCSKLDN